MAKDRISRKQSRSALLLRWNENPDLDNSESGLDYANDNDLFPIDEMRTLRLNQGGISDFTPPKLERPRPTLSPKILLNYAENNDEELTFSDDEVPDRLNSQNLKLNQAKHARMDSGILPATLLTSLPIRRRSLSDYSEGTQTDITEMNEEDFEELDDIFGKEESGIYSSGGQNPHMADTSRAGEQLSRKKKQLQQEAEIEDQELYLRYKKSHGDDVNTLKLKDLHRFQQESILDKDALENERTVNYEYTRDDFESFEDGFDLNLPTKIEPSKLRQLQSSTTDNRRIQHKMSMPVFPNSLKLSKQSKFRSTMDLAGSLNNNEHPVFNNSNKLIKKLGRMPLFHNRKELDDVLDQQNEELNYNMERTKKELLEKYMEITEKQKQMKASPRKTGPAMERVKSALRSGVGLVRYLNHKSAAPVVSGNGRMKFNARTKRWEGNEHDLLRFDEQNHDTIRKHPSLITSQDIDKRADTIKGNMKYDAENLRWINMDEDDNVFDDLPDLEPNDIPHYQMPPPTIVGERGVSAFTQRTVSTVSSDRSSALSTNAGDEFQLNPKLTAKFQKEEAKIRKKTHHWFAPNEHFKLDRQKPFSSEYYWDIRKMVMDDDNNAL